MMYLCIIEDAERTDVSKRGGETYCITGKTNYSRKEYYTMHKDMEREVVNPTNIPTMHTH